MSTTRSTISQWAVKTAYTLAILVPLIGEPCVATETDQYTYSYVPLRDSAPALNAILNQIFVWFTFEINNKIRHQKLNSDTAIEFEFSKMYLRKEFTGHVTKDVFSAFEICVDINQCPFWPNIDRVYLYPEESIYGSTHYSKITEHFLASTLMACGIRFGSDKLTHLLKDGFRYYNSAMDNRHNYSESEIERMSYVGEWGGMGASFTGVVSHADVAANVAGYRMFKDIFKNHLKWQGNRSSLEFEHIDICDYISSKFDERVYKNEYIYKNKVSALEAAIQARSEDAKYLNVSPEEILSRLPPQTEVGRWDMFWGTLKIAAHNFTSPGAMKASMPFVYNGNLKHRISTTLTEVGPSDQDVKTVNVINADNSKDD